uniref:STAT transcription factor DNA-binding domain-containing protein n=1 Tax=Plectus sambesii TaxID=2011161 RepID=A0A914WJX2_9BILA
MTYNAESINLNEFDINDLADISANLQISPNRGAEFIEQSLPLILQKLSHTEQDLKQKTQLMLADVLPNYERLQRLTQIGASLNDELNQQTVSIKRQYPALFKEVKHVIKYAHQLLLLLQQLEQMHPSYITQAKSMIQSFSQQCSLLYDQLVKRSILVVKQPDEIIKKGNQFDTQIVLLIDIPSPTPSVRIRIISAADAELLKTGAAQCTQISPAATTVNNQGTLNFNNGNLLSHFSKKPALKEISSRVNTAGGRRLAVTEQKYVVLYEIVLSSAVASGGTETIWALSLPIVLIVHASQLSDAYATIIWDRMFHNEVRLRLSFCTCTL